MEHELSEQYHRSGISTVTITSTILCTSTTAIKDFNHFEDLRPGREQRSIKLALSMPRPTHGTETIPDSPISYFRYRQSVSFKPLQTELPTPFTMPSQPGALKAKATAEHGESQAQYQISGEKPNPCLKIPSKERPQMI
ncbi:hypothetical protein HYFRA_00004780 [Hymenoscyphus fraxineus]|uniref:Uncharacterized protein n=1 Tax=Hymenoscyphus fraxineus TaxID=746836 RepID=A0A9N9KLF7_9HELO|nr:hypothetical protein HYFRA_00004780 [Hymenoscyphus fraxineus]